MKTGDRVTVVGIPPDSKDDERMQTRTLFEKCLGKTFTVFSMDEFDGVPFKLTRLEVGGVVGEKPCMHTIWVEEQYLRLEHSR